MLSSEAKAVIVHLHDIRAPVSADVRPDFEWGDGRLAIMSYRKDGPGLGFLGVGGPGPFGVLGLWGRSSSSELTCRSNRPASATRRCKLGYCSIGVWAVISGWRYRAPHRQRPALFEGFRSKYPASEIDHAVLLIIC